MGDLIWTEEDKQNSVQFFKSMESYSKAKRVLNSLDTDVVGWMSEQTMLEIKEQMRLALQNAELLTDIVLKKAHPDLHDHWRNEYQFGLRLYLDSYQTTDFQSQLKAQMLLDDFDTWFNKNNHEFKIPIR